MRTATFAVVATAALLVAALPAAAAPTYAEQSDRIVLANEHIAVEFQGKKPVLLVRAPTNESRSYKVMLERLVEVPPGQPFAQGEVASFALGRADGWTVRHTSTAEGVTLVMHREGALESKGLTERPEGVPLPDPLRNLTGDRTLPANASVTLTFRLSAQDTPVSAGTDAAVVTTYEVKFDLAVDRWDWVDEDDVLALEFVLAGPEGGGGVAEGAQVNVDRDGSRIGFVRWLPSAIATKGGNATAVSVVHRSAGGADEGSRHWLVYQAAGFDRLQHDPSVGVTPGPEDIALTGRSTPMGLAVLLAVPAAAVLLAARRKR